MSMSNKESRELNKMFEWNHKNADEPIDIDEVTEIADRLNKLEEENHNHDVCPVCEKERDEDLKSVWSAINYLHDKIEYGKV